MVPQESKLLKLLSNNDVTFFIPPYQRNYEWTEEQCQVFLDDVKKTSFNNLNGKEVEHFFGSITYFQDETPFGQPNKLVLIDGQQRITTTMLFLVALRDILEDKDLKAFIENKYLKNQSAAGDGEYKIKLKQVETDWNVYKNIVLGEPISDSEKESPVYRNYKYFQNKLKEYKENGNDLGALVDKGINKFSVITIELEPRKNSWESPQEIFESMNSLGKPLSLADLVRNYLLLGLDADTQTKLYNKHWMHIEKTVPHKVSDFIRDYMQCMAKKPFPKAYESNYKELYSSFKKLFDGLEASGLMESLSEYSNIYACIIGDAKSGSTRIDTILADLRRINVTTAYSFIMALLYEWKHGSFLEDDAANILDVFKIYCFRRRLLGITSAENKNFPMLTNKIIDLKRADNKKVKMFEILANQESNTRLPNDIEAARILETMNFFNFKHCKLFLSMIEEKLTKSRPDQNDKKLQIEHIMPQKLNDRWRDDLGQKADDIHQTYVNNIGNLTLIRHNQELGQKPFSEKKEVYENNAGLQIARTEITNNDEWNDEAIKKRMRWMIDFLLNEVLPIPDEMRRRNNFSVKEHKGLSFVDLQIVDSYIDFIADPNIRAKVISDKEVEFEGKRWRLSPLTRELQVRRGTVSVSGSYQGAQYWEYDGMKLADIM